MASITMARCSASRVSGAALRAAHQRNAQARREVRRQGLQFFRLQHQQSRARGRAAVVAHRTPERGGHERDRRARIRVAQPGGHRARQRLALWRVEQQEVQPEPFAGQRQLLAHVAPVRGVRGPQRGVERL
ncbi:hypothetical protein ACFJI0_03320 [Hydrogenophaga sp. UC242_53]|uniref:hypothetical protein n=1 Tax=Hydrogenophaga sp. UC242_53 TaxID=3350170 RepID=UPI0036D437E2